MITVGEIRSNGRVPEPPRLGNRAETAQLVLDCETELSAGSLSEARFYLRQAGCRNVEQALADFEAYGVAKSYDYRGSDRVGPWRSVAVRRHPDSRAPRDSGVRGVRDPRAETRIGSGFAPSARNGAVAHSPAMR